MKHWTKRLLLTTFAVGLLQTATAFAANINMDLFYNGKHHAYNAKEISIMIDGQKFVDPNLPAVSIDGRTMLPMRGICQELGGQVTWNESARQVYVVTDTHTVVFEIGKTTGYTNGKAFTMDVAPMIINDRTVLPVRALTQALDVNLKWDDPTRTIHIGEVAENNNGNQSNENQETENQETQPNNPPQTQIATLNNIKTPTSKLDTQEFVIHATSRFTKYQQVILEDNKIVLDVYGAANGLAENALIDCENDDFSIFANALKQICIVLSKQIAGDGEGATKLIECHVQNAPDTQLAKDIAKSVITSSLTKAAMFGADANWGRILCAIGYTQGDFGVDTIDVTLSSGTDSVAVCQNGAGIPFSEQQAKSILEKQTVVIDIDMKQGKAEATAWGCDLTYDYVKINGDYRT